MSKKTALPRLVIAGTGGDSGKTLVSMGLAVSWRRSGKNVAVFKKGPDYIDAAWLEFAADSKARNLDTYMMGAEGVLHSFLLNGQDADICLIEGNRGLFDGADTEGTHSTAELAKLLKAPVILVHDIRKVTRTSAAVVLGCRHLDPDVNLAGVILNRAAGSRHERVARESIESITGIPVLGAIPRISEQGLLPDRHLGLVTPQEHPDISGVREKAAEIIDKYIDVSRIQALADRAPVSVCELPSEMISAPAQRTARIAYFSDSAFTFYYQDNLDALEAAGAELIPVSSLESDSLPPCGGLYIGGGFPETHAKQLSRNKPLLESVRSSAQEGLPIFAECGGLIFLCRSIGYENNTYPLAGLFPLDLEITAKPQGHGYMEVEVERENPYFPPGTRIRGHEFHYSRIASGWDQVQSIYAVKRGTGCGNRSDGLIFGNVLASYLHLHAAGTPQWAPNFVKAANDYQIRRT